MSHDLSTLSSFLSVNRSTTHGEIEGGVHWGWASNCRVRRLASSPV